MELHEQKETGHSNCIHILHFSGRFTVLRDAWLGFSAGPKEADP